MHLSRLLLLVTLFAPLIQAAPDSIAPGYGVLPFTAPAPGSYQLPSLGLAGDGDVLTSDKQPQTLHGVFGDKTVLLSFIYTTCSDVNGCPLATLVLQKIKQRLKQEPELAKQLRLVTLSFNPEHDTPEVMQHYGHTLSGGQLDWQFLTTRSNDALAPILEHYPQTLQKVYDVQGQFTGTFNHTLRVYLIDPQKRLRNIYSAAFLHPDTVINDIKTVLLDAPVPTNSTQTTTSELPAAQRFRAGDNKSDYEQANYQTQSVALGARLGQAMDLLATTRQPSLGLPPLPVPDSNPLTAEKIALGRLLFYDRRLSFNNTFSCALCHIPEQGFTSNELATSVGVEGRSVRRNAPTLFNTAYATTLFHDGRETSLEQQVWGPLLAHNEMANPSIGFVLDKINADAQYPSLFQQAFARSASMENVGMALASYQRILNAADSPFDRWYFAKVPDAISVSAQRGWQLFSGKAGCSQCHKVDKDAALFTDQQLHNTGIGYAHSMQPSVGKQRVQLAPGVFTEVDNSLLASVAENKTSDLGQYEITQNPAHRWRYKTPTLRNISLTAPYMHNGSLATLRDVLNFYNQGGIPNENLDPRIKPLQLTPNELEDLLAFLNTLTGSAVNALIADAFAAPIGEAR